jgi:hypothetical protein
MTYRYAAHTHDRFTPSSHRRKDWRPQIGGRVEEALAAASFWTLDCDEEFQPMFDGLDWTIRGGKDGRSHKISIDLPTAQSAISVFTELADREKSGIIFG